MNIRGTTAGPPVHSVLIKNLSFDATEADVKGALEACGEVESVHIRVNKSGRSRGMATAVFATAAGLEAALALDGTLTLEPFILTSTAPGAVMIFKNASPVDWGNRSHFLSLLHF